MGTCIQPSPYTAYSSPAPVLHYPAQMTVTVSSLLLVCVTTMRTVSPYVVSPTTSGGARGLTQDSVSAPLPSLDSTTIYKEEDGKEPIPQEEYDNFFWLVDSLLWDQEEEGRQFRRGWLMMPRPQFLMRTQGAYQQPQPFYREFVDSCYGLLCELGINNFINQMSRMIGK